MCREFTWLRCTVQDASCRSKTAPPRRRMMLAGQGTGGTSPHQACGAPHGKLVTKTSFIKEHEFLHRVAKHGGGDPRLRSASRGRGLGLFMGEGAGDLRARGGDWSWSHRWPRCTMSRVWEMVALAWPQALVSAPLCRPQGSRGFQRKWLQRPESNLSAAIVGTGGVGGVSAASGPEVSTK